MDIQEYIHSGIIESYVLGLADSDEAAELESLRAIYPELDHAIQNFEKELETTAMQHAVSPAPQLKPELFNKLNLQIPAKAPSNPGLTAIQNPNVKSKTAFLKYLAAASVLLFVISAGLNFYFYKKYTSAANENRQLVLQRSQLFAKNEAIQTRMNELNKNMQLISGPEMQKVTLGGVPGKENFNAVVYWSKTNKDVYLVANSLPQAPKGKQYQLWALFDGKPIDAGVLGNCDLVCKLKNIPNAQAFAITLEDEGGSPTPHLEQLYVIGKI